MALITKLGGQLCCGYCRNSRVVVVVIVIYRNLYTLQYIPFSLTTTAQRALQQSNTSKYKVVINHNKNKIKICFQGLFEDGQVIIT